MPEQASRPTASHADAGLLRSLAAEVNDSLRSVVQPGQRVALVDFPFYGNIGDSLIWLATVHALEQLGLGPLTYTASLRSYNEHQLRARVGDGVILLQGGGNFGDLYPVLQQLRERIIRAFPHNPIVQLPQSLHFRSAEALDRARAVIASHRSFTLMVRDHRTHAAAASSFDARIRLCPDMAFALGPLARYDAAYDVVWLKRTDFESRTGPLTEPPPGHLVTDWRVETVPAVARVASQLDTLTIRYPRWTGPLHRVRHALYERLARRRLRQGAKRLSQGRVVVTDRLHGHILALLLGIEHVVLDSLDGKVSALHETWTRTSALTHIAADLAEATAVADRLAQGHRGERLHAPS